MELNERQTALLMGASAEITHRNGVPVDDIRGTAHHIAFGVQPDIDHGWEQRQEGVHN